MWIYVAPIKLKDLCGPPLCGPKNDPHRSTQQFPFETARHCGQRHAKVQQEEPSAGPRYIGQTACHVLS